MFYPFTKRSADGNVVDPMQTRKAQRQAGKEAKEAANEKKAACAPPQQLSKSECDVRRAAFHDPNNNFTMLSSAADGDDDNDSGADDDDDDDGDNGNDMQRFRSCTGAARMAAVKALERTVCEDGVELSLEDLQNSLKEIKTSMQHLKEVLSRWVLCDPARVWDV